jgi:3-phenylpropionate/trans-cinnamate dioxygenase ferredoxin subunit
VTTFEMLALAPEQREVVTVGGRCVLVCNVGGVHYAVENRCTHQETTLHEGRIRHGFIACPLHGVRFDLKTGEPKGDLTRIPLRTFSVTEEGGTLTISDAES